MNFLCFLVLVLLVYINQTHSLTECPENWNQYKGEKCFQVLDKAKGKVDATSTCKNLVNNTSNLLSIKSGEEQLYLNDLLSKWSDKSENVWIGIKYITADKKYKWFDDTDVIYTNWLHSPPIGDLCVQMSLTKLTYGKWHDAVCEDEGLVVCEIKLTWDNEYMSEKLENATIRLVKLEKDPVPMGFIYTQLPDQADPQKLWPKLKWKEITANYSNLFFRAEDETDEDFGMIQNASAPRLVQINYTGIWFDEHSAKTDWKYFELEPGQWSGSLDATAVNEWSFNSSKGEIRPRNSAIRIWERIK